MSTRDLDAALVAPAEATSVLAGRARGPSSLRPLYHRNYALLWSGSLVSNIGSWMQTVAVGALVTARTGEATWTVLVAAGAYLPVAIFSPVGGALADRLSRRRVLVAGNLIDALLAGVLTLLVAKGSGSPLVLVLIVALQGSVNAILIPFQQAILPELVPRADFLAAASLNSAQYNLGRVIGPALAGIAIGVFGYSVAFLANAVSFLAVVIALAFIKLALPPGTSGYISISGSIRLGARQANAEPGCRAAIISIAIIGLLGSPFIALVPYVARHVQHGGARSLASATAVLTTAQGIGAVTGALLLTPIAIRIGRGHMLQMLFVVLPMTLVFYGLTSSLISASIAIALVGFVYLGVLSSASTVVQLRAPARYRGRILSLYFVALGSSYPIGALIQGPLADHFGLRWTVCGAAIALEAILVTLGFLRPLARRALVEDRPAPATFVRSAQS